MDILNIFYIVLTALAALLIQLQFGQEVHLDGE